MLLIQIRKVEQSFIKIVRNSMLRTPLASPTFLRTSVKTKSSKEDIERIEKRINAIRSHCIRAEGREEKAYYKVLEELHKERSDVISRVKEKRGE